MCLYIQYWMPNSPCSFKNMYLVPVASKTFCWALMPASCLKIESNLDKNPSLVFKVRTLTPNGVLKLHWKRQLACCCSWTKVSLVLLRQSWIIILHVCLSTIIDFDKVKYFISNIKKVFSLLFLIFRSFASIRLIF